MKKSNLLVNLKLFDENGKVAHYLNTSKIMCVWSFLIGAKIIKAYLKVKYDKRREQYNDGYYYNKKDLKKAYSDFTEQELIKYLQ